MLGYLAELLQSCGFGESRPVDYYPLGGFSQGKGMSQEADREAKANF